MLAVPAKIAGCKTIVLATPPRKDGSISPEVLYVAKKAGVTHILKAGGAQAIAALAFGTQSCPKVDKIFGPGNQYVTAAKMLLQNAEAMVSIDMPAGPSEVLVIADEGANHTHVAIDLLSQAEHGPDSQVRERERAQPERLWWAGELRICSSAEKERERERKNESVDCLAHRRCKHRSSCSARAKSMLMQLKARLKSSCRLCQGPT